MISSKIDNVEWVENPDPDSPFFAEIVDANWESDAWHVHKDDFKLWMETLDDFVLYGAVEKDTKKAISCVFIVSSRNKNKNQPSDKFIGFYYTRPEYRSLGIGKCLFDKVAKHMNGYNVGLAAAIKMSPVYSNCYGMNKILDDHFWIYKIECKEAVLPKPCRSFKTCELTGANAADLIYYDKTIAQEIERSQQVLGWTQSPISTTRVAYDTTGKAVGICCIRKIRNALAIAPLYGDSLEAAQTLLHDTVSSIANWRAFSYFHSMCPESCKDANRLFDDLNNGKPSGRVADYIQFTDHLPTGYCYRKVFGIMECSTSVV